MFGWLRGPRLVLSAADLGAFEVVAGPDGLKIDHPAQLTVRMRRRDRLIGEEFCAELALALAERSLPGPAPGRGGASPLPEAGRQAESLPPTPET
jgi:hypothetical protein